MRSLFLKTSASASLLLPTSLVAARVFFNYPSLKSRFFTFRSSACSLSALAMPGVDPQQLEWPAAKVRDTYIKFFEDKNHVNWISSPVVPLNDPTLLFANAGMIN